MNQYQLQILQQQFQLIKVCHFEALLIRNSSFKFLSTERKPKLVFASTGKKATITDKISIAISALSRPTHIIINGAIATTGVT